MVYHPDFLFHYLKKSEHLIRTLVGDVLIIVRHCVIGFEILTPKLVDLKAAFIDVEMDIPLFKIWRTSLPHLGFGVQSLNGKPRAIANSSAVRIGRNEKDLQVVVISFPVDLQYNSSNVFTVNDNSVSFIIRIIDAIFNRLAGNDLSVKINMIVALTKFNHRAVLERPLIVKNKLLAVVYR